MSRTAILKTLLYLTTTILIGMATQLESLQYNFESITLNAWIGMLIKSSIPALISIKALFDTTTVQKIPSKSKQKVQHE